MAQTVLDWPAPLEPAGGSYALRTLTSLWQSERNLQARRAKRGEALWVAELQFENITREEAGQIEALLARIDGPLGAVRLPDFFHRDPLGGVLLNDTEYLNEGGQPWHDGATFDDGSGFKDAGGTEIDDAAAAGAETLNLRGFYSSVGGLKAGDRFSIGADRMHMICADSAIDSEGRATVTIRPRLRAAVTKRTAVTFFSPTCKMRLISDDEGRFSSTDARYRTLALRFIEDVL